MVRVVRLGHMTNGLFKVSFFLAHAGCALNKAPRQEYSLREILAQPRQRKSLTE